LKHPEISLQRTENPRVGGSIPSLGTISFTISWGYDTDRSPLTISDADYDADGKLTNITSPLALSMYSLDRTCWRNRISIPTCIINFGPPLLVYIIYSMIFGIGS